MDLQPYVETIHRQLLVAAESGGDESRALAERLVAPLDATIRLTLQDALGAAAEEITCEMAPGSVDLRLRGREPEFVVMPPPAELVAEAAPDGRPRPTAAATTDPDDGAMSRINLRMPDQLKARVEQAAAAEGFSVNAWLVRAATSALERGSEPRSESRGPRSTQRFSGWTR
jgi:HicB family